MAATTISNMIVPVIQADYMAAVFPSLSPLLGSGVVEIDPNPRFRDQGGNLFDVPQYLEFSTASVAQPTGDSEGTKNPLATSKDTGVICRRETGLASLDQSSLASGSNISAEIQRQAPIYWAKDTAKTLYNALSGLFATALAGANFTLAVPDTFKPSAVKDIGAMGAVGDTWPTFTIWLMRSTQFFQAINEGLVNYVNAGAFGERLLQTGQVPTILGKQVIVDDNIADVDGSTYLCKPGALYLAFQQNFAVEYQRDASIGGGTDEYWLRAHYMPHPRGGVYGGAASPTNTTLATGASWSAASALSTDPKLARVVKVKFNNA